MGILFSKLFKYLFGDSPIKIVILGLDNAGKTTILYRLKLGRIIKTIPTCGFNLETIKYEGLTLDVWDLAGQKNSRLLWRNYLENTNSIMFVIDSTDKKRIENVKYELDLILHNERLAGIPLCFCLNKWDLDNKMTEEDVVFQLGLSEIKNREWQLFKTIGKSGVGIDEAFKWIARQHNDRNEDQNEDFHIISQDEDKGNHEADENGISNGHNRNSSEYVDDEKETIMKANN